MTALILWASLGLFELDGKWRVCPNQTQYRGRLVCLDWAGSRTEIKIVAASSALTVHFNPELELENGRKLRHCKLEKRGTISNVENSSSGLVITYSYSEVEVLDQGNNYSRCKSAVKRLFPVSATEVIRFDFSRALQVQFTGEPLRLIQMIKPLQP